MAAVARITVRGEAAPWDPKTDGQSQRRSVGGWWIETTWGRRGRGSHGGGTPVTKREGNKARRKMSGGTFGSKEVGGEKELEEEGS